MAALTRQKCSPAEEPVSVHRGGFFLSFACIHIRFSQLLANTNYTGSIDFLVVFRR